MFNLQTFFNLIHQDNKSKQTQKKKSRSNKATTDQATKFSKMW